MKTNLPVEGIVPHRAGTALCWWIVGNILQLLVDPLQSHLKWWVGLDRGGKGEVGQ